MKKIPTDRGRTDMAGLDLWKSLAYLRNAKELLHGRNIWGVIKPDKKAKVRCYRESNTQIRNLETTEDFLLGEKYD